LPLLIIDIEKSLEAITKWLKQSGMVSWRQTPAYCSYCDQAWWRQHYR
jgi:hypothetical protein